MIDARRPAEHELVTVTIDAARPGRMAGDIVFVGPLAFEQRLGFAVVELLSPVGSDRVAAMMPDRGRRTVAERSALLLQPPAYVDVIAGDGKLRIEAANRIERAPAKSHIAAGDMFGLFI